MEIIFKRLQI